MSIEIYYSKATLYPAIFSVAATTLITYIDFSAYLSGPQRNYVVRMSLGASFVYSIIVSALCLPIYLVKIGFIQRNKV